MQVTQETNYKVYMTKDYEMFNIIEGNRPINASHIRKLKISMRKKYLISPLIVNEKFQVIDGQHRLFAIKELNLPVYFIKVFGYTKDDIIIYNVNQKNWGMHDYFNHHISRGREEYLTLKRFMQDFDFILPTALSIVFRISEVGATTLESYQFKQGTWKFNTYLESMRFAKFYQKIRNKYEFAKTRNFIKALRIVYSHKNFDSERFLTNIEKYGYLIELRGKTSDYVTLFEELYNFHRAKKYQLYERFKKHGSDKHK